MQRRPYLIMLLPALGLAAVALAGGMIVPAWAGPILVGACWLALAPVSLAAWSEDPRQPRPGSIPHHDESRFPAARLLASAILIVAHGVLMSTLVLLPVHWWQGQPSLTSTLAIAAGTTIALLLPWRWWPALVLPVLDRGEGLDSAARAPDRVIRALRAARELTSRSELYFSHGLPILLAHGALLLAPAFAMLATGVWQVHLLVVVAMLLLGWLGYGFAQRRVRKLLDRMQAGSSPVVEVP